MRKLRRAAQKCDFACTVKNMDYIIKSLKMKADAGDVNAMVELGKKFANGDGVKQSKGKAEKYFKKAAKHNSAEGYIQLGNLYFSPYGDNEKSETVWTKAANLGSDEAMYLVGSLYYKKGEAVRNRDKAEMWLQKPAKRGYAPAQLALGYLYLDAGESEEQILEGRDWFKKAAEQGNTEAQYMYGCLISGDKERTPLEALKEGEKWLTKAANGGHAEAYYELGNMYAYAYEEQFIDKEKALASFKAAADAGLWEAETAMGAFLCDSGKVKEGIAAYTKAAEAGNSIAMSMLGDMYYEGEHVERDYNKAFYWYSQEFSKYSEPTYFGLGRCYLYGAGCDRDEDKAFKYLTKAAKYVEEAQYELGNCYFNGWGTKQNKYKAKQLWEQAAANDCEHAKEALEKNFAEKTNLLKDFLYD